jgi:hypothetical protein
MSPKGRSGRRSGFPLARARSSRARAQTWSGPAINLPFASSSLSVPVKSRLAGSRMVIWCMAKPDGFSRKPVGAIGTSQRCSPVIHSRQFRASSRLCSRGKRTRAHPERGPGRRDFAGGAPKQLAITPGHQILGVITWSQSSFRLVRFLTTAVSEVERLVEDASPQLRPRQYPNSSYWWCSVET